MTDEEAGYLAENLWLYRVRWRMSRQAVAAKIVTNEQYRDYEYAAAIPSQEEVEAFAARMQTNVDALLQPPDYKWLMKNFRVRKVLELYCRIQNRKRRHAVLEVLRGLQK